MSDDYQTYPLTMAHPHFRPSQITVLESGSALDRSLGARVSGTPAQYPPVTVLSETEEEYYRAQGYEPAGKIDPSAWVQAHSDAPPDTYVPQKYPMWKNGREIRSAADDPDATPEDLAAMDDDEDVPAPRVVHESVEMANMRAQLEAMQAEMAKMMAAKPKRGRPPKSAL